LAFIAKKSMRYLAIRFGLRERGYFQDSMRGEIAEWVARAYVAMRLADRELGGLVETVKAKALLPHSKGGAARLGRGRYF
jgi:hypothetical protein